MSSQTRPPLPPPPPTSIPVAKPSVPGKRPRDTESDANNIPPLPENNIIQTSKKSKGCPPPLPPPATILKPRFTQKQKKQFMPLSSLPPTSRSTPPPPPHEPPISISLKQLKSLPVVSEPEVMGPPRLPVRRQHQKRTPAVQLSQQQNPDLTDLKKILERNRGKYFPDNRAVFIPISDPSIAINFYSLLTASTGVQDLQIALNWQWTRHDVEKLEDAVRQCMVSCIKLDGCYYRTLFCADGSHKTRFRPLIQLLGCKTLTQVYFINMAECLEDIEFNLPDDLSHLRVLQIHVEFTDWSGTIAQRFYDILGRLTHLERLVIDCPKDHFRDYLENTLHAFSLQPYTTAATIATYTSATPPGDIVEIQLLHERRTHVVAHFKRQGVVPMTLHVDLRRVLGYEVNWKPILDSPMAQSINDFQLLNARRDDWLASVRKWLGTRQEQNQLQQPPTSLATTAATRDDNNTTTTCTTTSAARLLKITLDCRDITSARELAFIRLLGNALSSDLQLQHLCLHNLYLPLPPPSLPEVFSSTREVMQYEEEEEEEEEEEGTGVPDPSSFKKGGCNGWSTLFMGGSLHNLERFEVTGCSFGDNDVEGFVCFAKKMKMMSDRAEKKLHERKEREKLERETRRIRKAVERVAQRKRRSEERVALMKLRAEEMEDGEIDEAEKIKTEEGNEEDVEDDGKGDSCAYSVDDIERVSLKTVSIWKHCLTPKGRRQLLEKVGRAKPPFELYLDSPKKILTKK